MLVFIYLFYTHNGITIYARTTGIYMVIIMGIDSILQQVVNNLYSASNLYLYKTINCLLPNYKNK